MAQQLEARQVLNTSPSHLTCTSLLNKARHGPFLPTFSGLIWYVLRYCRFSGYGNVKKPISKRQRGCPFLSTSFYTRPLIQQNSIKSGALVSSFPADMLFQSSSNTTPSKHGSLKTKPFTLLLLATQTPDLCFHSLMFFFS